MADNRLAAYESDLFDSVINLKYSDSTAPADRHILERLNDEFDDLIPEGYSRLGAFDQLHHTALTASYRLAADAYMERISTEIVELSGKRFAIATALKLAAPATDPSAAEDDATPTDASETAERTPARPSGPFTLADYPNQKRVRTALQVMTSAAAAQHDAIDHLLLTGPSDIDRTELVRVAVADIGRHLTIIDVAQIRDNTVLTSLILVAQPLDVFLIENLDLAPLRFQAQLCEIIDNPTIEIPLGDQSLTLDVPPITLIGSASRIDQISGQLRSRLGPHLTFEYHDRQTLTPFVAAMAATMNVPLSDEAAAAVAQRGRGTPTRIRSLLARVQDYATVKGRTIDPILVGEALMLWDIDSDGLTATDHKYLKVLAQADEPVSLTTIASLLSLDRDEVSERIEPYLRHIDAIELRPSGRALTPPGRTLTKGVQNDTTAV